MLTGGFPKTKTTEPDGSLRTAFPHSAFPVVACDDRKCVCCSQANRMAEFREPVERLLYLILGCLVL